MSIRRRQGIKCVGFILLFFFLALDADEAFTGGFHVF